MPVLTTTVTRSSLIVCVVLEYSDFNAQLDPSRVSILFDAEKEPRSSRISAKLHFQLYSPLYSFFSPVSPPKISRSVFSNPATKTTTIKQFQAKDVSFPIVPYRFESSEKEFPFLQSCSLFFPLCNSSHDIRNCVRS